jgi:hypothetical protein
VDTGDFVRESRRPCDLTPCERRGVETLRLVVDGDVAELTTCAPHADWLRSFVAEDDPAVALVEVGGVDFEGAYEDEQLEA